jgi:hypothetical protein
MNYSSFSFVLCLNKSALTFEVELPVTFYFKATWLYLFCFFGFHQPF